MLLNKKNITTISLYGAIHAIVDFCCAAMIYSYVGILDIQMHLKYIVIYNVLAFGMQLFLGLAADKLKHPDWFAMAGCLMLAIGIILYQQPLVAITLMGIGNALFHVGGGIISLNLEQGKSAFPGIFVAPGAIGLLFGAYLWKLPVFHIVWLVILPVVSAVLLCLIKPPLYESSQKENSVTIPVISLLTILILISVCIRSFIGLSYDFSGKSSFVLITFFVFAVALGKACGGVLADKFGMFNTAVIGLLLSIPLLQYGYIPELAILGIFCFNFTMPITLTAIANMMPTYKGFAFGLTTMALLIGSLPFLEGFKVSQTMLFTEIIILSVIITAIGLKIYEKLFNRS